MTQHTTWQIARQIAMRAGATLLTAAALSGCSSSADAPTEGTKTPATRPASVTPAARPAVAHSNVAVTLKDFGVAATPASAPTGHVTFVVQNTGVTPHELVVVKSDLAANRLPTASGLVDESKVTIVGRTALLTPGDGKEFSVELPKGTYSLICNVIGHYNSGQFVAFTVK